MGRPLRFSLNFVYTVCMAIGKIWLKEPHRQMSPRAPEGPSKFHESWFLPHGWKKSTRIWANYTSLERTQFSKQNIQITFFVWGPRGPDRALWKFGTNGEALRFSLNFVYTVYMAIGKIWLKEPHRQMSPRAPEGPSKFMNHGFYPMDESNQQESEQIIHHWKELSFPNKISK